MKRLSLVLVLIFVIFVTGCNGENNNYVKKEANTLQNISSEEMKKIDLYVMVMKSAFYEENGGNGFIAVKMDTLEGLSQKSKQEILNKLKDISSNVYPFEEIKNDSTKFEQDQNGNLIRSINGTLLSVRVEKWSDNKVIIEATSWFGNLGAVFPKYEAKYKSGKWQLKLIEMAIS